MNKKLTGIVIGITLVAIIGASGAYIYSQNRDIEVIDNPPVILQEDIELPEKDNTEVENIQIEDDGSMTAIIDGEAFAADPVEEDNKTVEESTYDLGKELGLSDEEIAEAIGQDIPDNRVETPSTETPSTSTPENPLAQNNNSNGQQNTETPDPKPSNGENDIKSGDTDETGNKVWTPPEGFIAPGDTSDVDMVEGPGDGTIGPGGENIHFQ